MGNGTTNAGRAETESRADIYQRISDQIAAIKAGAGKWVSRHRTGAELTVRAARPC